MKGNRIIEKKFQNKHNFFDEVFFSKTLLLTNLFSIFNSEQFFIKINLQILIFLNIKKKFIIYLKKIFLFSINLIF